MATQTLMTFEEFMNLPDKPGVKRELLHGRLIETSFKDSDMPHASFIHGIVQAQISHLLISHIEKTGADLLVSQNTDFRLNEDVTFAPDVCLVKKGSYNPVQLESGALPGAPELAVEIVSKNEKAIDLEEKTQSYLKAGTSTMWVIYPKTRHILVYRRSGEVTNVFAGQTFSEPDLLPGLTVSVDEIFAKVPEIKRLRE